MTDDTKLLIGLYPELLELTELRASRESVEIAIHAAVLDALSAGCSWRVIGRALGTSGQAAWERYLPATDYGRPMPGQDALFDK